MVKFLSKPRLRKLLITAGIGLALACVLLPASYWFAPSLLCLRDTEIAADTIVLLGGECFHRPTQAAELFKKGLAPQIIITGSKDWNENRLALVAQGIPPGALEFEEKARTTRENAELTVPILRAQKAKRVILVTSWFHSRRALRCFQTAAPEMQFVSLPSCAGMKPSLWPSNGEGLRRFVFLEYLKTAVYCVRFGITPWTSKGAS
jgi:uncharacterized SAM-binding protein YcdF (DUF218 family)